MTVYTEHDVRQIMAAVVMAHPCTFPKGFVTEHKMNEPVSPDRIRQDQLDAVLRRLNAS